MTYAIRKLAEKLAVAEKEMTQKRFKANVYEEYERSYFISVGYFNGLVKAMEILARVTFECELPIPIRLRDKAKERATEKAKP